MTTKVRIENAGPRPVRVTTFLIGEMDSRTSNNSYRLDASNPAITEYVHSHQEIVITEIDE